MLQPLQLLGLRIEEQDIISNWDKRWVVVGNNNASASGQPVSFPDEFRNLASAGGIETRCGFIIENDVW